MLPNLQLVAASPGSLLVNRIIRVQDCHLRASV